VAFTKNAPLRVKAPTIQLSAARGKRLLDEQTNVIQPKG
jgi:hypothetical protein